MRRADVEVLAGLRPPFAVVRLAEVPEEDLARVVPERGRDALGFCQGWMSGGSREQRARRGLPQVTVWFEPGAQLAASVGEVILGVMTSSCWG
ncbi:hypothetical protein B0H17DRAFT_1079289 [Mycena rosella]|uniref:Uncharacterized protein n=1 Tax=Mycena rosella TaxID=1033263 RepID=A0AAD7D7H5_MYCRO|nr:hypothetical protein B0H17DRAFT_1079289 [Mycena rosella]